MTPRTFADLLDAPGDPKTSMLVGSDDDGDHQLTLGDLRHIAAGAARRFAVGDGVMLYRPPDSPEAPLAGLLFGLLAAGIRVYLPAALGATTAAHLDHVDPAVLISDQSRRSDLADATRIQLDALARARGIEHLDLRSMLDGWTNPAVDDPSAPARSPRADLLCLTTSGTTGEPKALRYHESAWMACGAAFDAAGLLTTELLGGPTLCPGLAHSMGVRSVMLALWTRQPIVFIQPEWPRTAPHEVARLLAAHPPRHITGGPALLGMLPALARAEPRVRRIVKGLRVVVSSGAPFDPRLSERLPGVRLANAFGTTETQQISSTLVDARDPVGSLGRPLPGVEWRVVEGQLEVNSPFGATGLLGGPAWPRWFSTGDRVKIDDRGRLWHQGRADDAISTGLGVEIAIGPVEARFAALPGVERLVLLPHPACPGLLALAFVGDTPSDAPRLARIADAMRARSLSHPPDAPFDADRVWAVACVVGHPPSRGPGKLDRARVARDHADLLDALADDARAVGVDLVHPFEDTPHPAWPGRGPRLAAIALDWRFTGGRGDTLVGTRGDTQRDVLDLVGGFGVNLLGHGHPPVLDAARQALDGLAICDQVSDRRDENHLCRMLAERVGRETRRPYAIALVNTGSEAVDLALRHALVRRADLLTAHHAELQSRFGGRNPTAVRAVIDANRAHAAATPPVVVGLEGGFHGLTVAARALADPNHARHRLIAPVVSMRTIRLPRAATEADIRALAAERLDLCTLVDGPDGPRHVPWRPSNLLAIFVEAVQGEGGVHPIDAEVMHGLAALDAPLVIDEIQAGLGRTGRFIAAGDVPAEVYLFGKGLGGGVAKIAAVAIHRTHLAPDFDRVRGSTFAGDRLSCRVASTVLAEIDRLDVPARAAELGRSIGRTLRAVHSRWPDVIAAVRGRGLLYGVELHGPPAHAGPIIRALADRGWGLVAASWLLNRRGVRVLPTVGAPSVLRIEPSIMLGDGDLARLEVALDALCATLRAGDEAAIIGHWAGATLDPVTRPRTPTPTSRPTRRVAFIHPLQSPLRALTAAGPGLDRLDPRTRRALLDRLLRLMPAEPLPTFSHALFGGRVALDGITLCAPPAAFALLHRRGEAGPLRDAVQAALTVARDRGAEIAVLGGYTSVVCRAGLGVEPPDGLRVVTGNAFTVAAIHDALPRALRKAGLDPADPGLRLAILGATGNIGGALAAVITRDRRWHGSVSLIGRPGSLRRLCAVRDGIIDGMPDGMNDTAESIRISDDPHAMRDADVIIAAVNTPDPFEAIWLGEDRPVVLLDASAPSIVPDGLARSRPRVHTARAGFVPLPHDPRVRIGGLLRPGTVFACAAEGLLFALDPQLSADLSPDASIGPIAPETVERLAAAGRRHGLLSSD